MKYLFISVKHQLCNLTLDKLYMNNDPIAIYLDNELIKSVENQKVLGVTIHNTLTLKHKLTQVNIVCQNNTKRLF